MKRTVKDKKTSRAMFKNRDEAFAHLDTALGSGDPREFLIALGDVRDVLDIDVDLLVRKTGLSSQHAYNIMSAYGNPRWNNFRTLIDAAGFQLKIVPRRK